MKERIQASDGVEIYAEAHGEGIPLIFSCGFCTTRENWRAQVAPMVAAGARVILWDYRGHGLSGCPDSPQAYTLEQVISDLGRVLDWACPGEAAVLAGHSFGGLASLHFAARAPGRAGGFVLMSAGPGFKNPTAATKWAEQCERTASFLEKRGLDAFLAGRAGETCVGRRPELPEALAASVAIAAQNVSALAMFGREVAGKAPPVMDALPGLTSPALVLVGSEDANYLRAAEVLEAKLGCARREVLPGIGHVANLEDSALFNAHVAAFLETLVSQRK